MNCYRYEVVVYDEQANYKEQANIEKKYFGFTFGESYAEAFEHITKHFSKDEIISINNFAWISDFSCLDIPPEYSIDHITVYNQYT